MKKAYILDASAIFLAFRAKGSIFTTSNVIEEVRREEETTFIDLLIKEGLKIVSPPKNFLEKAMNLAKEVGEARKLSITDITLLALSLYLKEKGMEVYLVTEDFALQNVSISTGINVITLKNRMISSIIFWEFYCPGCGKRVDSGVDVCPICGTPIKRRPKIKKELRA